jgi:hypothetical protein
MHYARKLSSSGLCIGGNVTVLLTVSDTYTQRICGDANRGGADGGVALSF